MNPPDLDPPTRAILAVLADAGYFVGVGRDGDAAVVKATDPSGESWTVAPGRVRRAVRAGRAGGVRAGGRVNCGPPVLAQKLAHDLRSAEGLWGALARAEVRRESGLAWPKTRFRVHQRTPQKRSSI